MGKLQEETAVPGGNEPASGSACCCTNSPLCEKSTFRWIITLILTLQLLVFTVLSIPFFGRSHKHALPIQSSPSQAQIEASFWLRRPASVINASLFQLETDLQDEVGIPSAQVRVLSLLSFASSNWTEVVFGILSEPSNESISPADISVMRETFVELFLEHSVNLSLNKDIFGKAYTFEVLVFPGGITVVPVQSGYPLQVLVLFNFTLHDTLTHLNSKFKELKQQLAAGISLKANESLFVQLTNLNGSTVRAPVIVQTSVMPVVGLMLAPPRLKQLAQRIITSPRRNLGLNRTLFGRIKELELSSYLKYTLKPAEVPSPAPSPLPAIPIVYPPLSPAVPFPEHSRWHWQHSSCYVPAAAPSHLRFHHRHHQQHPRYKSISPVYHHLRPALSPYISPFLQPSPHVNPHNPAHPPLHGNALVSPFPAFSPISKPHFITSAPHPVPVHEPAISSLPPGGPPDAPRRTISTSGTDPTALYIPESSVPAPTFPSTSSALILGLPIWYVIAGAIMILISYV
eukprot:c22744_g3_i1 orf=382-1926(-)